MSWVNERSQATGHLAMSNIDCQDSIAMSINMTSHSSSSQDSWTTEDSLGPNEEEAPREQDLLNGPSKRSMSTNEDAWQRQKPEISRLYRRHTLDEVIEWMRDNRDFTARYVAELTKSADGSNSDGSFLIH